MTRVLAYFTLREERSEEIELDTPADDLDYPTIADALRALRPFDELELDDWEVLKDGEAS